MEKNKNLTEVGLLSVLKTFIAEKSFRIEAKVTIVPTNWLHRNSDDNITEMSEENRITLQEEL